MKCRTSLLGVAGIVVFCFASHAQTTTIRSGKWSSPSTWSNGIVPDASGPEIIINHDIDIPEDTIIAVDELVVNAKLTIAKHAQLILQNARDRPDDLFVQSGNLLIYGRITCKDSATIVGTTAANTFFFDSSFYEHQYFSIAGEPPTATWSDHSTLELTGFTTGKSLSSLKWNQAYGNVIYNCTAQRSGTFVELLGNIQAIKNNLLIKSTGAGVLRMTLDKTALTTINVGGDFIIEGRSMVWMSRNGNTRINVAGNFEYRSTATASSYLTTQGNGELNIDGNFLMNSPGILRFASSGGGRGTINVQKDFSLTAGTMTLVSPGQGRISMVGSTPQSLSIQGTIASGVTMEIANALGVNVGNNSKMSADMLIKSSGKLKLPSNTFLLQGNLTMETGADLLSNHGTLLLNGTNTQTVSLLGDTLHHVTISKPSGTTVSVSTRMNLTGVLSISNAGVTVVSNGNLAVLSTNDNGSEEASIATLPFGSAIEGDVTVQRYMTGEGRIYRYLSSPVQHATVADWKDDFPITGTFDDPSSGSGMNTRSPSLFAYDETLSNRGWINFPAGGIAAENILEPGKGYSAFIRNSNAPTVWEVTGRLNQHSITIPVTYTATVDSLMDGWNLVGNPYASSLDWDRDEGWTRQNISSKIAIRDNSTGTFKYWDGSVGNLTNGRIAIGQAFWIQSTAPDPVLTINENAKAAAPAVFFRTKKQDVDALQVSLSGERISDECFLKLDPAANNHFDRHDLMKWQNDALNFSFIMDSIALAIDTRNLIDCETDILLVMNFTARSDGSFNPTYFGNYTLSFDTRGLFKHVSISLHDHYLDSVINNYDHAYNFVIDNNPSSHRKNRFSLNIRSIAEKNILVIDYDSLVCEASPDPVIRIQNAHRGIRYDCWMDNQIISSVIADEDTSRSFSVSKNILSPGKNDIRLLARNACTVTDNYNLSIHKSKEFSPPVLIESDGKLISSAKGDWFIDGQVIAEDISAIVPVVSGWYDQEIGVNGCTASARKYFTYQETGWRCAPVPTNGLVTITAPKGSMINHIEIISPTGITCEQIQYDNQKEVVLNMGRFSPGMYFARISGTLPPVTVRLFRE